MLIKDIPNLLKWKSSNLDESLVPNPGWNSQKPPLGSINAERYDLKWPSVPQSYIMKGHDL